MEGGAATLVVTPERDTVLMDTGWPRPDARDAGRIQAAMRDAGITEIDYLLILALPSRPCRRARGAGGAGADR